ncbi:uncharacterized [Tachysurus ichikawai]
MPHAMLCNMRQDGTIKAFSPAQSETQQLSVCNMLKYSNLKRVILQGGCRRPCGTGVVVDCQRGQLNMSRDTGWHRWERRSFVISRDSQQYFFLSLYSPYPPFHSLLNGNVDQLPRAQCPKLGPTPSMSVSSTL